MAILALCRMISADMGASFILSSFAGAGARLRHVGKLTKIVSPFRALWPLLRV